jgi:hypothetical protein
MFRPIEPSSGQIQNIILVQIWCGVDRASSIMCGNKMPTRCNRWIFLIADLIACSTRFGHHYAYHQELVSIVQVVAACRIWCLVFKLSVWCGTEGCVSGLRAAATCTIFSSSWWWAQWCPKHVEQAIRSAIKIHLLHLVGILFPHIILVHSVSESRVLSTRGRTQTAGLQI